MKARECSSSPQNVLSDRRGAAGAAVPASARGASIMIHGQLRSLRAPSPPSANHARLGLLVAAQLPVASAAAAGAAGRDRLIVCGIHGLQRLDGACRSKSMKRGVQTPAVYDLLAKCS